MALFETRIEYAPHEYPQAYRYWELQNQSHWLHHEIAMAGDIQDWSESLTEHERKVVGGILKGFVQSEVIIADYWTTKVNRWFKKPEIQMMAAAFGNYQH